MRCLKIGIFLFTLLLSRHAFPAENPVTPEVLKGIIERLAFKMAATTFDLSIYKDGEPRGEFQGVAAFKIPDRITLKLFGPFGLTILDLIGKDGVLQLYVPSEDELYQGDLPKDLWLIFGILEERYQYVMEETEDYYILYLLGFEEGSLSIRAKYYFDKIAMIYRKVDILKNGKSQFRVEINKFRDDFPLYVTFHLPSGLSLAIKNRDVKLDVSPPDELFLLKKTEGRDVKELRKIVDEKM